MLLDGLYTPSNLIELRSEVILFSLANSLAPADNSRPNFNSLLFESCSGLE